MVSEQNKNLTLKHWLVDRHRPSTCVPCNRRNLRERSTTSLPTTTALACITVTLIAMLKTRLLARPYSRKTTSIHQKSMTISQYHAPIRPLKPLGCLIGYSDREFTSCHNLRERGEKIWVSIVLGYMYSEGSFASPRSPNQMVDRKTGNCEATEPCTTYSAALKTCPPKIESVSSWQVYGGA